MRMRAATVGLVVAATTAVSGCTRDDRGAAWVLRYNDINPPHTPQGKFAGEFARLASDHTRGKIAIDVYYGASLVGYSIEPVQTGIVDFNQMLPSSVADLCPKMSVLDAPYLWTSEDQIMETTDPRSPIMAELNECLEDSNLRLLIVVPIGMRHLTTTSKPVYRPADLEGLKIRVVPSPVYQATLEAMGAIPTPMPFPELPTALATGVVDGQENPYCVIVPHGLHEIQEHIMLTGHLPTNAGIFMNLSIWNRLTAPEQEELMDAAIEARALTIDWVHEMNDEWIAKALAKGVDIIGPDDALRLDEFIAVTRESVRQQFEQEWGALYGEIAHAGK